MSAGPDPVVVVGLGPVGATIALLLARRGVRVVAIERDPEVYPHPRAVALDDEALRVLQETGVLGPEGLGLLPGGTVRLTGRDGRTLVELPPPPTDTGHPALSFFRQPDLERRLRALLLAEPLVEVRPGCAVVRVVQDAEGATVTMRGAAGDGGPGAVRASYVLGCDGGRSTVRAGLGVRLRGGTSGRRWLVVDGGEPAGAGGMGRVRGDFTFACEPARPWVHGALPGGAHRWEFLLGAGEDDVAIRSPDVVGALLARRHGAAPAVGRAAVYAFHARVAPRWRIGRVLLAGDAAHLSPPFAGQGLGAGLRDARNLAWKLAAVVRAEAPPALLDTYVRERLPHVLRTTALALGLGLLVQVRRGRAARARDGLLGTLVRVPAVRRWTVRGGWRPSSRVGGRLVARGPHGGRAGEPLPQPRVSTGCGERLLLDDALPAGRVLLAPGPGGLERVAAAARGAAPAAGGPSAAVAGSGPAEGPAPVATLHVGPGRSLDDGGALRAWIAPAEVVLVRPDRVVFGTSPASQADVLVRAMRVAVGRPGASG